MNRVVHFEFDIENPERALKFYTEVFKWKIDKWEGPVNYWLITTGSNDEPGINGAFMLKSERGEALGLGTLNTIEASSVDDCIEKIKSSGGKVIAPKQAVPGVGYQAYCEDTEKNIFGIMQNDPSAK